VAVFGAPLNNGALPLNATVVMTLLRKEAWCTAEGTVRSRRRAVRIWIHRTCPLAGTAATGQSGRELGAGPDQPDS